MHNLTLSSTTQIEWKLRRGQWRPKLLDFAKAVPNDTIQGASQLAYAVAEEATVSNAEEYTKMCKAALEPLLKIKVRVGQIFLCVASCKFPVRSKVQFILKCRG